MRRQLGRRAELLAVRYPALRRWVTPGERSAATVARPWAQHWEAWTIEDEAWSKSFFLNSVEDKDLAFAPASILAVPARWAVPVALWVESSDPEVIQESARLELELRGLLPRGEDQGGVSYRWTVEGERTLVAATVFQTAAVDRLTDKVFESYEASPWLLPLEKDSVTLWEEGEDVVMAFTRGEWPVYWETCPRSSSAGEVTNLARGVLFQLQAEGLMANDVRAFNWLPAAPTKQEEFLKGVSWTSREATDRSPAPRRDEESFGWMPPAARQQSQEREKGQRIQQIGVLVAVAYAIILLMALAFSGFQNWRLARAQQTLKELEAQVEDLAPVIAEWKAVADTVSPEVYPLELLHRFVEEMPQRGVRLTAFRVNDGVVQVEGESKSISIASGYFTSLEKSEGLAHLQLEMASPTLLPNNEARFSITGTVQSL